MPYSSWMAVVYGCLVWYAFAEFKPKKYRSGELGPRVVKLFLFLTFALFKLYIKKFKICCSESFNSITFYLASLNGYQ